MTACGHSRSIFDLCPDDETLIGLREVNLHPNTKPAATHELEERSSEDVRHRECSLLRDVSDKMLCSACRCSFTNREEQTEHYKLDWHRFNLRQKMAGMAPATAEEFEEKTGAGDMSSISGSDSDSEEDESDRDGGGTSGNAGGSNDNSVVGGRISSKVVFQNSTGQYVSVYRCILQGKSGGEQDMGSSFSALHKKTLWVVLMTGGGHFAGAVFQGKDVLQHKTFHRYTVRAKRGTAQGLRDSQNRSHTPKSAGAALRRHNEAALVKDIQDLLLSWAEHLQEASAIFVRAPTYNKSIFFGGRRAPLLKTDPRIRTLPFATRRATFREVQRVHTMLSTVLIYEKDTDMSALSSMSKVWKKRVQPAAQLNTDDDKVENNQESSDQEEGGEIQLETVEVTLKTTDLKEFDVQGSRNKKKKKKKRRKREEEEKKENEVVADAGEEDEDEDAAEPEDSKLEKEEAGERPSDGGLLMSREPPSFSPAALRVDTSWEFGLRDALFTACKVGDVEGLCALLRVPAETPEQSEPALLNQPVDSSGFTLLHVASAAAQRTTLRLLLDTGADPACRDNKGRTPYAVAPDKDTRNVFRKYMGENPERYDYSKAQVPGPLTAEIEGKKAEKKKAQRAQRKQREKTQRDEQRRQEQEEEEKKRFASLSEREKRALAAEKRLAEQVAETGVGLSNIRRCWLCGESLLGKIPFQYLDFSFCTPRCVQAHRKARSASGRT